ncbi:MAG: hypothetical protein IT376_17720 [Polyangiaceae bacterium]|nr:hypothetical protein [Polyangiaceae bacterium]
MYRRTTREIPLASAPPAVAEALARHCADHQLTLDPARCRAWHTHSENPEAAGFFGKLLGRRANPADPDAEHDSVLVLHPTHVVLATTGKARGSVAMSLPLLQASVRRGSALPAHLAARVPGASEGITLSGFPGHVGRPGEYFFGLGEGPAAQRCATAVEAAVAAAKAGG